MHKDFILKILSYFLNYSTDKLMAKQIMDINREILIVVYI